MLKALVKSRLMMAWQAAANIGGRQKHRKLMKGLVIGLLIYGALTISAMMGFFFSGLAGPFAQAGLGWFYFALSGLNAFAISFLSCIFIAQPMLFQARDNDLLLSLPIPPGTILLGRMATLYLFGLVIGLLCLLPPALVWAFEVGMSAVGWLYFALICLTLPLMALALSSILGWALAVISARLRRKTAIVILLSVVFMLGYFALMSQMNSLLARLVKEGQRLADAFRRLLPPAYHLGMALADGNGLSLLVYLLYALIPFAMIWLILRRFFIRIATSNPGAPRAKYVEKPLKAISPTLALTRKELRLLFQSPMYLLNSGFGLIFMLALPALLIIKPDVLTPLLAEFKVPPDMLGMAALAALCLMASSVMISAPSVSLEGKTLWMAQSLPLSPGQVLTSKAYAHMAVGIPAALISGLALGLVLRLDAFFILTLALIPAMVVVFVGLCGVYINLKFPKFDWNSQTEAVKQGASVIITMAAGFAAVALPGLLYALVLRKSMADSIFLLLYALILALMSAALFVKLLRHSDRDFVALHP